MILSRLSNRIERTFYFFFFFLIRAVLISGIEITSRYSTQWLTKISEQLPVENFDVRIYYILCIID